MRQDKFDFGNQPKSFMARSDELDGQAEQYRGMIRGMISSVRFQ